MSTNDQGKESTSSISMSESNMPPETTISRICAYCSDNITVPAYACVRPLTNEELKQYKIYHRPLSYEIKRNPQLILDRRLIYHENCLVRWALGADEVLFGPFLELFQTMNQLIYDKIDIISPAAELL